MKDRISLQIVEGRLVLPAVIDAPGLRVRRQFTEFVIDTGSPDSYLSYKDVLKFQIPMSNRPSKSEVDFGGSRFKCAKLPKIRLFLLKNKDSKDYITLNISISALKTTKTSEKKKQIAQTLPSILGIDFLKEQKLSLHVILTENMAYLQFEE